jgi:glycosyltransferase 2 family protein
MMASIDAVLKPSQSPSGGALKKSASLVLRLAVGMGILAYLAKSGQINLSSLAGLYHAWPVSILAVGVLLLDIVLMSFRASLLFASASLSLSFWNSLQLNLIGFLFSTFLPGAAGGDIAKVYYATKENHGRRAEVTTILILDRLVGLFSLVLLPLLFAPFFLPLLRSVPVLARLLWMDWLLAAAMLVGAALTMFFSPTRSWVSLLLEKWPSIRNLALRVVDAMAAQGKARGKLFVALLLSLLANMALIVVTALGFTVVNPGLFSVNLALVAPLGHLVNSLPLTPGGIGVGETAFNTLFSLAKMSGGAETLLCLRLWNLAVGALGLLVYLFGMGRIVHPYEDEPAEAASSGLRVESLSKP